jgi:hypothetical protein
LLALGIGALFSGVALLGHIVAGFWLPLSLAVTVGLLVAAVALIWLRLDWPQRAILRSMAVRGVVIGLIATLLYDASRTLLSQLDSSVYQPFEVLSMFGRALLGGGVSSEAALAAGLAFHLLNGVSFGLAYVFILGRQAVSSPTRALATGITWGLFLETFQLTLYPGWLNIAAYREFVTISFLGHVVYGATLGIMARRLLAGLEAPSGDPGPAGDEDWTAEDDDD